MNRKLNCWEFRNCGMEPGGVFSEIYGTCPIPQAMKSDGINGGRAAGRICWKILDGSKSEPSDLIACRSPHRSCSMCEFYQRVHTEENKECQLQNERVNQLKITIS